MQTLYTIGYERADLGDFITTLMEVGISHVMDVRELPQSRRKGFSKNQLRAELEENGIGYSHWRALGDPKEGRDAAKNGDFDTFRSIFTSHLGKSETRAAIEEAKHFIKRELVVLLCYERDARNCHRKILADCFARECSISVRHLGVAMNGGRQSKEAA